MHLADLYSLSSGSKISKPHINLKYFPLNVEKYITLHSTSKETKTYDHWQMVVDSLLPILNKNKITIVQIGAKEDRLINGCHSLLGQCNIGQTCHVISNGLMHVGADSFPVHVASAMGKKIVALYSNNFIKNVGPYWSAPNDVILLEPKRKEGHKPSFLISGEKSINGIPPETIVESVLKLLNIEHETIYKTLFIGGAFNNRTIESLPDNPLNISNLGIQNLIVRMDLLFNEPVLFQQLQHCRCLIITDRPINLQLLHAARTNVCEIIYIINSKTAPNPLFCKDLFSMKIPFKLMSWENDEFLNKWKLDFIDCPGHIFRRGSDLPSEIDPTKLKDGKIFFKSNKFIIAGGKIYQSMQSFSNGKSIPTLNSIEERVENENVIDLLKEKEHYVFFEKTS